MNEYTDASKLAEEIAENQTADSENLTGGEYPSVKSKSRGFSFDTKKALFMLLGGCTQAETAKKVGVVPSVISRFAKLQPENVRADILSAAEKRRERDKRKRDAGGNTATPPPTPRKNTPSQGTRAPVNKASAPPPEVTAPAAPEKSWCEEASERIGSVLSTLRPDDDAATVSAVHMLVDQIIRQGFRRSCPQPGGESGEPNRAV